VRWSPHALKNLVDREIQRDEADRTLAAPDLVAPGQPGRTVLMRRYFDQIIQREMLLRVIVEQTVDETVVVTVYKTSQIDRYTRGSEP
jgi:hypothetical protein